MRFESLEVVPCALGGAPRGGSGFRACLEHDAQRLSDMASSFGAAAEVESSSFEPWTPLTSSRIDQTWIKNGSKVDKRPMVFNGFHDVFMMFGLRIAYNSVMTVCEKMSAWSVALFDLGALRLERDAFSFDLLTSAHGKASRWRDALRLAPGGDLMACDAALQACAEAGERCHGTTLLVASERLRAARSASSFLWALSVLCIDDKAVLHDACQRAAEPQDAREAALFLYSTAMLCAENAKAQSAFIKVYHMTDVHVTHLHIHLIHVRVYDLKKFTRERRLALRLCAEDG